MRMHGFDRRRELGGFSFDSGKTEAVRAFNARSSAVLEAIETTVTGLTRHAELFRLLASHAQEMSRELGRGVDAVIDRDGSIAAGMRTTADSLACVHQDAKESLRAARMAPELRPDDGVVCAWEDFIGATADFFNAIEDFRDTLETLDSLKIPAEPKVYTDARELTADLLK